MVIFIQWADGGSDIIRNCGSIEQSVKMIFRFWEKYHSNIYRLDLCEESGVIYKSYAIGGAWVV